MRRIRAALTLSLGLAAVLGLASCASDLTESAPPPQQSLVGDLANNVTGTLLLCSPEAEVKVEKVIGKAGGTIRMGQHTLIIPAGALRKDVKITAEVKRDVSNSVRLEPHGLTFAKGKPATLTMGYSNCLLKDLPLPKKVAYTSDSLAIYYWLTSIDLGGADLVQTSLDHFSRYAVGY